MRIHDSFNYSKTPHRLDSQSIIRSHQPIRALQLFTSRQRVLVPSVHCCSQARHNKSSTSLTKMEVASTIRLLEWNKGLISMLGLWPLSRNDTWFILCLSCLLIHVILEYVDLYLLGNNFEHVVANLSENVLYTLILIDVTLLHVNSHKLGQVIRAVYEDCVEENYKTCVERKILLDTFKKSRMFLVLEVPLVIFTATSYYLTPFMNLLKTMNGNSTGELKLPYHTYIFYDVSTIEPYALTYAAQLPFVFFSAFGSVGPICLVMSLTLHVSGELAIVAERIKNVNTGGQECALAIKGIVEKHVRLIQLRNTLEELYNMILLVHFLGSMFLICVLSYYVLANTEEDQNTDFFSFTLYVTCVILHIFGYCYMGECLIQESTKVHDALRACRWYGMSPAHASMLIICMARSQQPLVLTAGKFYTFSMNSFANVMKTSMAYLSVLRSFL